MRLYNEREGIALDMEKIEKNLGRKVTAKLMLNSFWGKFGEQVNKLQLQKYTKAYQLFFLFIYFFFNFFFFIFT